MDSVKTCVIRLGKKFSLWLLIIMITFACVKSFDLSTNLEVAEKPVSNQSEENAEIHVNESLKVMYPDIGKYDMKIENGIYETDFKIGGNHFRVKFDEYGNWIESEVNIQFNYRIPENINAGINNSEFKNWFLTDKTLYESPGARQYKMEFKKGEEEWDVYFNPKGEIVKKAYEIKKTVR